MTRREARRRLTAVGANAIVDGASHPLLQAIRKLWAPVPWMLETAILLQIGLADDLQAGVVALLRLFNAALGFVQESRAGKTLAALRLRLALVSSVRRDGIWAKRPTADLVHLSEPARHGDER